MTDEAPHYSSLETTSPSTTLLTIRAASMVIATEKAGEKINTNTVEGYYSIFKRGMIGVYQHCGEQHLHRYLAEFDFRYSNRVKLGVNDTDRATAPWRA